MTHTNPSPLPNAPDGGNPAPCLVVIFGASGDLTRRKLLPALYHLAAARLLPDDFAIVGVARRDLSATFRDDMKDGIVEGGGVEADDPGLAAFMERVQYFATNFDDDAGFAKLRQRLAELDGRFGTGGNRLFYLAVAPEFFADIIARLGAHGMTAAEDGETWTRVIIEKPFGTDLDSARRLNDDINAVLDEDQIFRIDHYLGKEAVQNLLTFRFRNAVFEPLWNRTHIAHVEITAAESIGIEGRGAFYEQAGALRDVLQNHVMEVLALVAMERPDAFQGEAVRAEKLKLWQAIGVIEPENAVRGQYGPGTTADGAAGGYRQEDRVAPDSNVETYAAIRVDIDNPRWNGVPFYLRAGKRLAKRVTEIRLVFKQEEEGLEANVLTLRIQPDEGVMLRFTVKTPGPVAATSQADIRFGYADTFGKSWDNGYERLLRDAMLGDATLFAHRDGVEATWKLFTKLLGKWGRETDTKFPNYAAGSQGPEAADALLARDGHDWHRL